MAYFTDDFLKKSCADEKYHDIVRFWAHRKTGQERTDAILAISEHSLALAAKTATTCAKNELVLQAIYQKAISTNSFDADLCLSILKEANFPTF